jgi:hypothetical protein
MFGPKIIDQFQWVFSSGAQLFPGTFSTKVSFTSVALSRCGKATEVHNPTLSRSTAQLQQNQRTGDQSSLHLPATDVRIEVRHCTIRGQKCRQQPFTCPMHLSDHPMLSSKKILAQLSMQANIPSP